jgi:hypothetical protein
VGALVKTFLKFSIFAVIGIILCLFALTCCFRLPDDKSLRGYFHAHETTYQTLLGMLQEDKNITRICQGEIAIHDPKDPVSDIIVKPVDQTNFPQNRFDRYRKLIAEVDAESIWQDGDKSVLFSKGGWGFAGYGPRWGYVWLSTPPSQREMLTTMDDFRKRGPYPNDTRRYVLIEDHWYMFILAR